MGKLLGPKGNSMKRLQEDTMTKMAVLGRGSMKDKQKVSKWTSNPPFRPTWNYFPRFYVRSMGEAAGWALLEGWGLEGGREKTFS